MSAPIRTLLAFDGREESSSFRELLPTEAGVEIVGVIDSGHRSWGVGRAPNADIVAVACSGFSDTGLDLVDQAVKEEAERPVVVFSASPPNGFLRRAFEAGADDIVVLPESPEKVLFALEKAVARKRGARLATGSALAPMISVLGPKGGSGKTLTAVNLAVSMAGRGMRPVIVDLDLQFGDVALALGLAPERTVYDLATSGGALDGEKLADFLAYHESGVRVLLAPIRPDQASTITPDFLRQVWRLLRSEFDAVIVDTPPDLTPEVIAAVDASSDVVIVGMLDSLSIKNTKLGLDTLDLMGVDRERIRVVLNRADSQVGIARDDVSRVLGREPDVFVPSDRHVPLSVNEGLPIVQTRPRSDTAKAFGVLAALYGAVEEARRRRLSWRRERASSSKRRLFSRRRAA